MTDVVNGGIDEDRGGGGDRPAAVVRTRPAPIHSAARLAADRHSRRVRLLKIVLPIAAAAIALVIVAVAWVQSRLQGSIDVKTVLFSKDGLTMVEPHLTGHASGRSYDVSAQRAFQNIQNPKIIGLEGIDGRIEMADGTWAKIESLKGLYDGTREWLTLDDRVVVTTSTGWRADSEHAEVDLKTGHIVSDHEIRIDGKAASIASEGIDVSDGGHHVRFLKNVRMTVRPGEGDADKPAGTSSLPEKRP